MFRVLLFLDDHFRSKEHLIGLVRAYGVKPPSIGAIEQWRRRGAIPGVWFPVLLFLLEMEHGCVPSLARYVHFGVRHERHVQ